jgi:hypothetical protein
MTTSLNEQLARAILLEDVPLILGCTFWKHEFAHVDTLNPDENATFQRVSRRFTYAAALRWIMDIPKDLSDLLRVHQRMLPCAWC